VSLSITVFIFKSFYCIVLEKMKGKLTPNTEVHSSTYTMSHVQTLKKKFFLHGFAHSFNIFLFRGQLDISLLYLLSISFTV